MRSISTASARLIDAAENGLGIALGIAPLIGPRLATGRLVMPFGPLLPLQHAYWLACRKNDGAKPAIKALRDWLLELMQRADASMQPQLPKQPGERRGGESHWRNDTCQKDCKTQGQVNLVHLTPACFAFVAAVPAFLLSPYDRLTCHH